MMLTHHQIVYKILLVNLLFLFLINQLGIQCIYMIILKSLIFSIIFLSFFYFLMHLAAFIGLIILIFDLLQALNY